MSTTTVSRTIPVLKQAEPNHIPALDGLRGLAILLVLFRHLANFGADGRGKLGYYIYMASLHGSLGVDLFFVLSGFLITGILFDTLHTPNYFKTFYMRRFLRIFPLYYGFLLVLLLFAHRLRIEWNGMLPVFFSYTQNIFIGKIASTLWGYTGQLWSLAVEEQFYLFWPFFVFFIRDRKSLMWTAGSLSVAALAFRIVLIHHGVASLLVYRLTPCRMDELLAGAWVALALRGGGRAKILRYAFPIFLSCCACYIVLQRVAQTGSFSSFNLLDTVEPSFIAVGFAALLVVTLNVNSTVSRALENRSMRWLGKYSYGIYVYHLACFQLAWMTMNNLPGLSARLHLMRSTMFVTVAAAFVASLGTAWISYNFYEIHFLKLKRYFSYSRPPQQPVLQG